MGMLQKRSTTSKAPLSMMGLPSDDGTPTGLVSLPAFNPSARMDSPATTCTCGHGQKLARMRAEVHHTQTHTHTPQSCIQFSTVAHPSHPLTCTHTHGPFVGACIRVILISRPSSRAPPCRKLTVVSNPEVTHTLKVRNRAHAHTNTHACMQLLCPFCRTPYALRRNTLLTATPTASTPLTATLIFQHHRL
jgi:hypothetical protein